MKLIVCLPFCSICLVQYIGTENYPPMQFRYSAHKLCKVSMDVIPNFELCSVLRSFSLSHCVCYLLFVLSGHGCLKYTIVGAHPAPHFRPFSHAPKFFEALTNLLKKLTKLIFIHIKNLNSELEI